MQLRRPNRNGPPWRGHLRLLIIAATPLVLLVPLLIALSADASPTAGTARAVDPMAGAADASPTAGTARSVDPLVGTADASPTAGTARAVDPLVGTLVVLHERYEEPEVHLLDWGTGSELGDIAVDHNPHVLHRQTAKELLVADLPIEPGAGPRLRTFAISDGLELRSEVALPDRVMYSSYWPYWMIVSADEQYAYYVTQTNRVALADCRRVGEEQRRWDASVCDKHSVIIVDLDTSAVVATAEMRGGCGAPSLHVFESSSALVACPTGLISSVSPDGAVGVLGDVGGLAGSETFRVEEVRVMAAVDVPGGIGVLYFDGTYLEIRPDGITSVSRAVPEGKRVFMHQVSMIDASRMLIPIRDNYYDVTSSGVAVFNTETHMIERTFELEHDGAYAIDGSVVVLRSERIERLDIDSGRVLEVLSLPPVRRGEPARPFLVP